MSKICKFNKDTFSFEGTPVEQARCLLRKVLPLGNVGDAPAELPPVLARLIGQPVDVSLSKLAAFLSHEGVSEDDIGGPLSGPLSRTDGESGPVRQASY